METVSQVRETLTRSLENAKDQLKASREAKHQERETLAETAPVFLSLSYILSFLSLKSNRKSNFCRENRLACLAGNGLERQGR